MLCEKCAYVPISVKLTFIEILINYSTKQTVKILIICYVVSDLGLHCFSVPLKGHQVIWANYKRA